MTIHPIWPAWALILIVLPFVLFCLVQLVRQPRRRMAWARRTGLALALGIIAIGPSTIDTQAATAQTNASIFFVVDRTGSMAAEDWNGEEPRLDGVRHDIDAIVEEFPGARYSIIAWDSQATRQLPLTTDARAVRAWTDTMHQEITGYSVGSQVDRPLAALTDALEGAAERSPSDVRLVYFLSDGENTDGDASSADATLAPYTGLAPLVDGGAVLGYGTTEGGRMKVYTAAEGTAGGNYIQDPETGTDAISMIDETTLRTIAEELGVDYVHRIAPDEVTAFTSGIDLEDIAGDGRREQVIYRPIIWPEALIALGLLAWELWATMRSFPTRREVSV